jgi:uncharacterized membrane protein
VGQRLSVPHQIIIALVILSVSHAAISGSAVGLSTVQWDEFTDLRIAESLSSHPLIGSTHDGSQARFPMYVTAVAHGFMQIFNPDLELLELLPVSRWISILMTVLAIWGTFFLGSRLFNSTTGLLAATLFTFSPYVLQFGHDALTQGDAFTSATVLFALIAFDRFDVQRTTARLAGFSLVLSLAIASKFFLVILIPALITYQVIAKIKNISDNPVCYRDLLHSVERVTIPWSYLFLAIGTGFLALFTFIVSVLQFKQAAVTGHVMYHIFIGLWLTTLSGIGLSLLAAIKDSRIRKPSLAKPHSGWPLIWAWMAILPLTFAMVLALFPEHIFNRSVLPTLIKRFITVDGNNELLTTALVSAKLYLGLLLFKIGLPFGIATCMALVWGARKSIQNKKFLLVTLVLSYYGLLLAILPLQQPFWLMSIYPLILILLAAFILHNLTNLKNRRLRIGWAGYVAASAAWLVVGLFNVYPTFGFYGYELIGDRWLGNDSRGYRGVVVVTNDGSTEAIDWLRKNVPSGSMVLSYLNDIHIMNYLAARPQFSFELRHALHYESDGELSGQLAKADFVVVRLINDFGAPSPVSEPGFLARFTSAPVHQIVRGRGVYRMPVIQIYQRISI